MLIIREAQMRVLAQVMERQFEVRMLEFLRHAYADQLASHSNEAVLTLIRQGINRAELYGIVSEADVARFTGYMVGYGTEFDKTQPWAANILQTPEINGTQKMDRIDNYDLFEGRDGRR